MSISKYYKTFSGTDALVYLIFPKAVPINLGCITTITYSTYRDKKPVNLIGKIGTAGFTRGTRIVAGTMIFTVINQHFANEILKELPWLKIDGSLKADELPLFDIMIVAANEYGSAVQMMLYGVDITDENQVISVEDLFTENQLSFVARDVDTLLENPNVPDETIESSNKYISSYGYSDIIFK